MTTQVETFAQLCERFRAGECGRGTRPVGEVGQVLRRFQARSYYHATKDRRRKLAREGAERRRWAAWLLRELRAGWRQ